VFDVFLIYKPPFLTTQKSSSLTRVNFDFDSIFSIIADMVIFESAEEIIANSIVMI